MWKCHVLNCGGGDSANIPVILFDVAPRADISVDPVKLRRWFHWNRWLAQFASDRGYGLVKASDLLIDPSGLYRLDPRYITGSYTGDYTYTGDATHPVNNGGMLVLANALLSELYNAQQK